MKRNAMLLVAAVVAVPAFFSTAAMAGAGQPINLIPALKPNLSLHEDPSLRAGELTVLSGGATSDKALVLPTSVGRDGEGRDAMTAAIEAFTSGNYSLAKVLLSAPGRENDPVANYCLGVMREYGLGLGQNEAEAIKHYQIAAEGGHPQASFNLGLMFADGRGTGVDELSAFKWVKKAAEQGLPVAQHTLGLKYFNGTGTEQDPVQALMWFELAASAGNASSEQNRDSLAQSLKIDQRIKARQMASLWQPKMN